MTIRKIISYPNRLLTTPGEPVKLFDNSLNALIEDMFETMYMAKGVGLAASQIGVPLKLFVIDCDGLKLVAANPEIIKFSSQQEDAEGCLSISGIYYPLSRAQKVLLRAQDKLGEYYDIEGEGLIARCFLHETDHCNGKLYIHHLSRLKREILIRKYYKIRKRGSQEIS